MRSSLYCVFLVLGFGGLAFPSRAQSAVIEPQFTLTIRADSMQIDPQTGIPLHTRIITLTGQLTPQSIQVYPLLESKVLINEGYIYFARNGRRYGMVLWKGAQLPFGVYANLAQPRAGDRCGIEITDIRTRTKQGVTRKLSHHPTFHFP